MQEALACGGFSIVVDLVHVLEYIWAAAWSFHAKDDPAAEDWVAEKALAVLAGRARQVAESITAQADGSGLTGDQHTGIDACVRYLVSKEEYLRYDVALAAGWPIATGVVGRPAPDRRSLQHHRLPVERRGRRGRPQAPRHARQRGLRRVLGVSPAPRTPPRPPGRLPGRIRSHRLIEEVTAEEPHPTLFTPSTSSPAHAAHQ